jgi:ubiquinone/menaquinone biosynthesis C-methylase UbiE
MSIGPENLTGKTILEVGSGRGDTTRTLVTLLAKFPATTLIVTDIADTCFQELQDEFADQPVRTQFIQTDACTLDGVAPNSIDYVVCNYTLCAINAQAGRIVIALDRFWEVMQDRGKLFVEEEYPIDKKDNPAQEIWSDKWRILKTASILSGGIPYNELQPETLAEICRVMGYKAVQWTSATTFYPGVESLDFFQARLKKYLRNIPNLQVNQGLNELASGLVQRAAQTGGMEIPYYCLSARKGSLR